MSNAKKGNAPNKPFRVTRKMVERSFKENAGSLYDYSFSVIKHRAMADDIVQNTFLACLQITGDRLTDDALKRYLFTICHNKCADYLNKGKGFKNKRERAVPDPHLLVDNEEVDDQLFIDDFVKEHLDKLPQAIQQLPHQPRSVIELLYMEELTPKEVSEKLHMPVGHVWSYKAKAISWLRKWFGKLVRA